MNAEIENNFINLFIKKEKADRLKFELNKKDKRKFGIERFCHNTMNMIKKEYLYEKNKNSSTDEIYKKTKK